LNAKELPAVAAWNFGDHSDFTTRQIRIARGAVMSVRYLILVLGIALVAPSYGYAQGTIPGAERGAREGGNAAGPVGAVVGGAVGAATGTVGGVLGAPRDPGCDSETVRRENSEGESETIHRTNCP
jgi:hypothetical protein